MVLCTYMPYDKDLAERIRDLLSERPGVEEKKMFGGLTFLVGGNMACGVAAETLMVRVGAAAYEDALGHPHCRECDFTGRPLKGMVTIEPRGFASAGDLRAWVERGFSFAGSLPAK